MTNVTNQLTAAHKTQLNRQMASLFSSDVSRNSLLLESVLTETEQIMLIKRVAAILMINANYSIYRVAKTINLSHSTVARYKLALEAGEYDVLLSRTRTEKFNTKIFWQLVETLLRAGLPPMAGPGRWKDLSPVRGTRPDLRRTK